MTPNSKHINSIKLKEFEAVFRELFIPLCRFAYTFLKDQDISKEIVHDVFVRIWEKKDEIHLDTPLKSYLYTSVRNRSLNYLRDNSKIVKEDISNYHDLTKDSMEQADILELQELEERINISLNNLPEKCAQVFRMNRFDGLRYKEISKKLNISVKTVETHMSKALKLLREDLKDLLYLWILWMIINNF